MGETMMHREFEVETTFHAVDMFLRDTPPTVEDFELLPDVLEMSTDELTDPFIVYAVVLKKANHPTFIYCGSMANTKEGSVVRANQYQQIFRLCLDDVVEALDKKRYPIAKYVKKLALEDGYLPTHIGCLFRLRRMPKPEPASSDQESSISTPLQPFSLMLPDQDVLASRDLNVYLRAWALCLESVSTVVFWTFWRGQHSDPNDHYLRSVCP
ncbi:hypothetical protein PV04_01457 [Phialophora macrospora]|uniref:Uncharacterized protein n=1 Tax=Phialophora macrospora TaxID=1851006 RepID=A0A0D2D6X3_9EURO|nr:hypothetical protein PV04_01457 [Phialophora macrospora]